jgi:hypothetical protein
MAAMNADPRRTGDRRRPEATGPQPRDSSLRVQVPDDARGSRLVLQLADSQLTGSDAAGWAVVGSADRDLTDHLTTIRQWLRDEGIRRTTVHVGDHEHTMTDD